MCWGYGSGFWVEDFGVMSEKIMKNENGYDIMGIYGSVDE